MTSPDAWTLFFRLEMSKTPTGYLILTSRPTEHMNGQHYVADCFMIRLHRATSGKKATTMPGINSSAARTLWHNQVMRPV
jgi:hypothetical protein